MLIMIAGVMVFFLTTQYSTTSHVIRAKETRKDIPFQPLVWNNAIRNNIDM